MAPQSMGVSVQRRRKKFWGLAMTTPRAMLFSALSLHLANGSRQGYAEGVSLATLSSGLWQYLANTAKWGCIIVEHSMGLEMQEAVRTVLNSQWDSLENRVSVSVSYLYTCLWYPGHVIDVISHGKTIHGDRLFFENAIVPGSLLP